MKLYYRPLSGHSHRARLFLSIIGAEHELIPVGPGANRQPEFLALNRFGQVPVLEDDDVVVADSNAILVYLAKKYERTDWLPENAAEAAAVQKWLSVAANEIANGPCAARLVTVFNSPINAEQAIDLSHRILRIIDDALKGRAWIASQRATIADLALYSYVARAPEGNVDTSEYVEIHRWLASIEALPGFVHFAKSEIGPAKVA
jgi:glutathione S-transferase